MNAPNPLPCPAGSPYLKPDAITATLQALVGLNSVNPAYGGPEGGEQAVVEWAARFLTQAGLQPRLSKGIKGRPNLRVRLEGERPGPPILFETHVDTVSVKGMSIDPFAAEVRAGRLLGRGATDAKAQVAAMLHALAAWATSGQKPPQSIELVLAVDEEYGFGGSQALLAEGVEAAGIVIGEPTDLRIVTTHKGTIRWWIRVEGKSAHGAKPHLGINAISGAAALVEEIDRVYTPELQKRRAPLLEPPTINVGIIQGGLQANLVPPECRIHLDRRLIPGETEAQVAEELEALIERVRRRRPTLQAVLEPPTLAAPAMYTDPACPLVRMACEVAAAHGISPEPIGVDYATDASVLAATGAPIIIVGPGSIDQAHTGDEFVELSEVVKGAHFYAALIAHPLPKAVAQG